MQGQGLDLAFEFKAYGREIGPEPGPRARSRQRATFTRDNTEIAVDIDGVGRHHRAEAGGMIIALERWNAGLDTAAMFAELPDGACQEPHFGYVLTGSATVRYTDGATETLSPGQAYYLRPGHNVHTDEDAELVEFTQADQAPGINTLEL